MIECNPQKYIVRDDLYCSECERHLSRIEQAFNNGSLFSFLKAKKDLDNFEVIYKKNYDEYKNSYLNNLRAFESLKEKISWDFEEPFSEFESSTAPLINEIRVLLEERKYSSNRKARELICSLSALLDKYIDSTGLVDSNIRNRLNSRFGKIKVHLRTGTMFSLMNCDKLIREIESINELNDRNYNKVYIKLKKKLELLSLEFGTSSEYFSGKDKKIIEEQFVMADEIMKSQSYENFENAHDILDEIDVKLADISVEKKSRIKDSISKELERIKTDIWSEDWEQISKVVEQLIAEADQTGKLYNLNLDKFNIDQKISDKRNAVSEFIMSLEKKNIENRQELVLTAQQILKEISSRASLEELKASIVEKKQNIKKPEKGVSEKSGSKIKVIILSGLMILSVVLFAYNHFASSEHFNIQGQKYADVVETLVFAMKKSGAEIDPAAIRRKITAPSDIFEIVSITDTEVTVKYRGGIYRKKVRK
jgi:hypothetical protein